MSEVALFREESDEQRKLAMETRSGHVYGEASIDNECEEGTLERSDSAAELIRIKAEEGDMAKSGTAMAGILKFLVQQQREERLKRREERLEQQQRENRLLEILERAHTEWNGPPTYRRQ